MAGHVHGAELRICATDAESAGAAATGWGFVGGLSRKRGGQGYRWTSSCSEGSADMTGGLGCCGMLRCMPSSEEVDSQSPAPSGGGR